MVCFLVGMSSQKCFTVPRAPGYHTCFCWDTFAARLGISFKTPSLWFFNVFYKPLHFLRSNLLYTSRKLSTIPLTFQVEKMRWNLHTFNFFQLTTLPHVHPSPATRTPMTDANPTWNTSNLCSIANASCHRMACAKALSMLLKASTFAAWGALSANGGCQKIIGWFLGG